LTSKPWLPRSDGLFLADFSMSILVICPGCKKRFKVSDEHAGKSGPCPNCKAVIKIPEKAGEVEVLDPRQLGASVRGATGVWAKPIARKETRLSPVAAVSIGGTTVVVLLTTWLLGRAGVFTESAAVRVIGLLLVSPPLVVAGYLFLHHEEDLEPYRGKALYIRAGVCSLVYMALWGAFGYVAGQGLIEEIWSWLYVAPPFFLLGALAALASLDLDFGTGFFHYSFYVFVTVLLRGLAQLGWVWQISEQPLG
jgi:hypothetical protein